MFNKNLSSAPRLRAALFCVFGCAALLFNFAGVSAQKRHFETSVQNAAAAAPIISATMTDAFPDPESDGNATPGTEVTYTATVTNSGNADASNVVFTNPVDANSTLIADSVTVQPDYSPFVVRCSFSTLGSGGCNLASSDYGLTDSNNFTIIGGQNSRLNIAATNLAYNFGTEIFSFDATVQNLLAQSFGTIDGVTPEATGVRLFMQSVTVTSGSGAVSAANADGAAVFTAPNQSYFQYNEILVQNQISNPKTLQLSVPNTVSAFTVDFLVSTKVAAKLVVNEVLVNPGGTISDANGEWFELLNTGLFPVNMQNFYIGDTAASGDRPIHLIQTASPLTIQPNGFLVFGNTTNTTNNGGVPVNYAYGAALALSNGGPDAVRILSPYSIPANPLATPPTVGTFIELDRANYPSVTSGQNGLSRELKAPSLDNSNMDNANWQYGSVSYGPGGFGTPGAVNTTVVPPFQIANIKSPPGFDAALAPDETNAGEVVSIPVGTLAPGQSATVTFRATISNVLTADVMQISTQGTFAGSNFTSVLTDDTAFGGTGDPTVTPILRPTAATAFVSGRVMNADGFGVANARVSMTAQDGGTNFAATDSLGYYGFSDVPTGETFIVSVNHKKYVFTARVISVNEDVTELNFTARNILLF